MIGKCKWENFVFNFATASRIIQIDPLLYDFELRFSGLCESVKGFKLLQSRNEILPWIKRGFRVINKKFRTVFFSAAVAADGERLKGEQSN